MADGQHPRDEPLPPHLPDDLGAHGALEEAERMRGGRGGLVVALALVALAVLGGLAAMMLGDPKSPYETFGRNINGLEATRFDSFWACALGPGTELRTNADLTTALHERAERGRARFARLLRERCLEHLEALETGLRALIPPEELRGDAGELMESVHALRGAFEDYAAHLEGLGDAGYERDANEARVLAIARAWYEYRHLHAGLNAAVRVQLE